MGPESIGKWPVPGKEARVKPPKHYLITRRDALQVIHGKDHPMLETFYVSNDFIHFSTIELPSGGESVRSSEPEIHKGDEALYVLNGPIAVFLPATEDTFEVKDGEVMFVPEGIKHQYVNYTQHVVKAIHVVAPEI